MTDDLLARLRELCLAFPESTEKLTWEDSHTFRVRDKIFAMTGHDHDGRIGVWCKGAPGAQDVLLGAAPGRYYSPPYVGNKGWIGAHLDRNTNWDELAALVEDSFRLVAPRRIAAKLDE
jgi:predicted DNA-binding protein (MmcQ/YjbR family)